MKPRKIKGILFDFDGVIAKTMEDNFKAWKLAMEDFNSQIGEEDYYPFEGKSLKELAKGYCRKFMFDESNWEEIVRKKEEYYLRNHKFEFYPGVDELIVFLKSKKVKIGLVTAALYPRLKNSVSNAFLEKFDAIVSGDKTERGKPFPDPYVKCLEDLKLKSNECVVIENAPLGIKSAKSAGIYCIAIASTLDKSYLNEADESVTEFKELHNQLKNYV